MQGKVEMGRYDTGVHLQEAGIVSGYDSTVESAVTKLMFLQSHYDDPEQVRYFMNRSIRGEITV
jgi:L-asparaginase